METGMGRNRIQAVANKYGCASVCAVVLSTSALVAGLPGSLAWAQPSGLLVELEPAQVAGAVGDWTGTLSIGAFKLRLDVHLKSDPEDPKKLTGTMDSPDQGAMGIPITHAEVRGDELGFEIRAAGAQFKGKLNDQGEYVGTWQQGSQNLPLILKRGSTDIKRPQTPVPPFDYVVEDVRFENPDGGHKLAGTLTLPKDTSRPVAATILVTGSGPQDRDEALFSHKPFAVIADALTKRGIAVLRYDDRGFGESGGKFSTATVTEFTSDAAAAVAYLRKDARIDADRVGVIGHSEGGLVAPLIAAEDDQIGFIVLLAAPGVPLDQLMRKQWRDMGRVMGATEERLVEADGTADAMLEIILSEAETNEETAAALRAVIVESLKTAPPEEKKMVEEMGGPDASIQTMLSVWFRDLMRRDPAVALNKVTCPVLSITGEKDLQVAPGMNQSAIEAALKAGGNMQATVKTLPNLNHLFQNADTGSIAEYGQIEETFDLQALQLMVDWVVEHSANH